MRISDWSSDVCSSDLRRRALVSRRCELGAVVGQHGMDLVGKRLDQAVQEISSGAPGGALVQLGKGELGDTVDRHEHLELAVLGAHFGDVDVNISDRLALEPLLALFAIDARQPAASLAPDTTIRP